MTGDGVGTGKGHRLWRQVPLRALVNGSDALIFTVYYVPGTALNTLPGLSHLILKTIL